MFYHISVHALTAVAVQDHPFDPFDNSIEFYQTWHLAALEDIAATSASSWARQGSSARGAPDDGVTLREGNKLLPVDPQITLGIADAAMAAGQKAQFRLDFHNWDSDSATEKVRAAFTDVTLQYMVNAFKAAREDAQKARAALEQWVAGEWKAASKAIASSVGAAGTWTPVGVNLLPMVELLVDMLRADGDDYFDMHRFILQQRGTGTGVEWQVTGPSGEPSGWKGGNQIVDVNARSSNSTRKNTIDLTYRFRLIA